MTPSLQKKFWAVAEAHRTAVSYEVPFSLLIQNGFTRSLLESFAYEFRVARSLIWCARNGATDAQYAEMKDQAKKAIMPQLLEVLNGLPAYQNNGLQNHFNELMQTVADYGQGENAVADLWERRNFPSGLSKFYMAKTGWHWPPFDGLAAKSVGAAAQNTQAQALQYYCLLDERGFTNIAESLTPFLGNDPYLKASRIIDKYLLLAGLNNWCFPAAYAAVQPKSTQDQWLEVALQMQNACIDGLLAPSIRERILQ